MRSGVVAQKMGMTRVFTDAGEHVPVTVLRLAQCQVVAHRTMETDKYVALQLGAGERRTNNMNKADRGYFAKAKVEPKRKLAEFRVTEDSLIPVGSPPIISFLANLSMSAASRSAKAMRVA